MVGTSSPALKSAKPASKKAAKKDNQKQPQQVLHSSVVVTELPADMKLIYHRTVRQMLPAVVQKSIPVPEIIEEADGATMIFEVDSKHIAEAMQKRLNRTTVYGNRWHVDILPVEALIPNQEANVVDVTLNPPGLACDVRQALQSVQGFLAVDHATARPQSGDDNEEDEANEAEEAKKATPHSAGRGGAEAPVKRLVAVFAEEGAAIHARAVLSGRLVGTQGSRMFLRLRRRAGPPAKKQ
ncbi:Hypothetical protein, putative [Bodo saltans]|uniref:Uncharacterized protein n=1 Tax=Bodo saltans TaxID=75058 RepID=A0A0S4J0K3_BODSA|nr:Hypothetical protein, putative [Bodo saltans]|eukprot:CUG39141.1 Hypothetical protein, putative [Bodo saltans]